MSRRTRRIALIAIAGTIAVARAQDEPARPPRDLGSRAREAIAVAHSELIAWARSERRDSDLRREVLSLPPPPEAFVPGEDAGTTHVTFGEALTRFTDLERRFARRRAEVLYGAAAPAEGAEVGELDRVEELHEVPELRRLGPSRLAYPPGVPPARGMAPNHVADDDALLPHLNPDRIRDLVAAEIEEPGATAEVEGRRLLVRATRRGQARARALLARIRGWIPAPIALTVRAVSVTGADLAELLADGPVLSAAAEERLARALADGKATLRAEQTVLATDGHAAFVRLGTTHVYPSTFVAAIGPAPIASTTGSARLDEGLSLELTPVLDRSRGRVSLAIDGACSKLSGEIARQRLLGHDVGTPELGIVRGGTTAILPVGRTTVVWGAYGSGGDALAEVPVGCVLTVRAIVAPLPEAPVAAMPATANDRPPEPLASPSPEARAELDRLARLAGFVHEAVVRIREAHVLRWDLIDARGLLAPDTDRYGPEVGVFRDSWATGFSFPFDRDDEGLDPPINEGELANAIKATTGGDDGWADPAAFEIRGWFVLARHAAAALDEVQRTANRLAARRGEPTFVQVDALRIDPGLLAAIDSSGTGSLSEEALARLERAAVRGDKAAFSGGAVLLLRDRERAYVSGGVERAFVTGVDSSPEGISPVVGLARTGLRVGVRARRAASGTIGLQLEIERARLESLAASETPAGAVRSPSIAVDLASVSAELPVRGGLLLRRSVAGTGKDARADVLLVRAR